MRKKPEKGVTPSINTVLKRAPSQHRISAHELALCSNSNARRVVPFDIAWKFCVLPLAIIRVDNQKEFFTLGVSPQSDYTIQRELRFLVDRELHVIEVPRELLREAILISYKGDPDYILSTTQQLEKSKKEEKKQQDATTLKGIPRTIQAILEYAYVHKATDIHIKPTKAHSIITLRINGEITKGALPKIEQSHHQELINRLKVLANCNHSKKNIAQDGSFTQRICEVDMTIRLSIVPTHCGEQAVLRIPLGDKLQKLEDLMLPHFTKNALESARKKKEGAIIFCGPTGSGKTTTMYSALSGNTLSNRHIITLEDPIERVLPFATQIQVDNDTNSYTKTLRSALRQDPDILMIGEMRDKESAQIALQATLTGHLVFSTLHARSILEIFLRLRHFEISPLDISQSLQIAISQRLLPKLCPACKIINIDHSRKHGVTIYQAAGCQLCNHTGYHGQVPIAETLVFDKKIRDTLLNGEHLSDIFKSKLYQSLRDSAHEQLCAGFIDQKEFEKIDQL